MEPDAIVFVVDADDALRESLEVLLQSEGLTVEAHATTESFLASYDSSRSGCLVLDVQMPDQHGLGLEEYLARHEIRVPVIIISAGADVEMAVRVMKSGAVDFIKKPLRSSALLARIREALELDAQARQAEAERAEVTAQLALLTPREREIMELLVTGKASKQIAFDLGVSRKTIDIHRQHIMMKLRVNSVVDLVQMIQISRGRSSHALARHMPPHGPDSPNSAGTK